MKKLIALLVLLFPALAFAESATATVANDLLSVVLYTVGIVAVGLVGLAAKYIANRFKVTVPSAWLSTMDGFIDKAIHYAEEWARGKIANSDTVNGNEKLNTAFGFLLKIIGDDKKLVTMTEEQIKTLIEARLGELRSMGVTQMLSATNEGSVLQTTPVDAKLLAVDAEGKATLHLTNGDAVDINTLLSSAGYARTVAPPVIAVKSPQAGYIAIGTLLSVSLLAFVVWLMVAACGGSGLTTADVKQIGKNGVNCTVGDLFSRAKEMAPSVEANVEASVDPATGKVNWDQAHASIGGFESDVAGCALAMAVDALLHITQGNGFAPLQIDRQSLVAGYDAVRKAQFGDRTFVVSTEAQR